MIADYKNPDPATTASSIQFWKYKADVKNISNMYPYGKSYGINAIYNASDDYRYGFNGMEKEKNIGQGFSDFGARMYDSEFPSFGSPDPHDFNYPGKSPYQPLNSNPIIYLDPDGKDYALFIDHDKKSITIKAYYKSSDIENKKEEDLINIGTKFWNEKSEKYDYVFISNGEELSYSIFIELDNIKSVTKKFPILNALDYINEIPVNTVTVISDDLWQKYKEDGVVSNKALAMNIRNSMVVPNGTSNDYARHEMGHNIGMTHVDRILNLPYTENVMNHSGLSQNVSSSNFNANLGQAGIGVLKNYEGGKGLNNSLKIGQPMKGGQVENFGSNEKGTRPSGFENGKVK